MITLRQAILVLISTCLLLLSVAGHAAPNCGSLRTKGEKAMLDLRYDEALALYEKAFACDPSKKSVLYNQGRALGALGRFPEALEMLLRFREEASKRLVAKVPDLKGLIEETRLKVSDLKIKVNVNGARVLVRSKQVGRTPITKPIKLNAGKAEVEVTKDGYIPYSKVVDLPGGDALALNVKLEARDPTGVLVVDSPVTGAKVRVDGKAIGTVPAEVEVLEGPHEVVVSHRDYEDAETSVVVTAGKQKSVMVDLDKGAPLTGQWWFWTGIGIVAVGTVVTILLLQPEDPKPDSGNIEPGRLSAPLWRF